MGMIRTEIRGAQVVVDGLENASNGLRKAAMLGVIEALQVAHAHCDAIISADDHSLRDLAEMGHPYSARNPQQIHDPDETVHEQSGEYRDALKAQKPKSYADGNIVEGEVGIDPENAEMRLLDRWIQTGTIKMRARRWSQRVIDDHGDEIAAPIEARLTEAIRDEAAS
jgi:hypothetical protein